MTHCDIELSTYQTLQKRVPEEDRLYENPQALLKLTPLVGYHQQLNQKPTQPTTMQPTTNTATATSTHHGLASNTKKHQLPRAFFRRNKLLTAIIVGLVALNVLLIICLTAVALQSYTEKQDVIRLIKDLKNSTAQLITDSRTNTAQGISAASSSQEQSISHHELQQTIVNMTTRLIEDMVKNITVQLMDSHTNTVHDLEVILTNNIKDIMTNITQVSASSIKQSTTHYHVLQQMMENTTQLLDTHMMNTYSTNQLLTQNLDTAITLIKNNAQSTLSSFATVVNTLSAVENSSLATQEIVQIENTQHKVLLETASCQEIKDIYPHSTSGNYTVNGEEMYCEMEELCGSEGGWTRLAYLDMNDTTVSCPSTLNYNYSSGIRACARPDNNLGSCASVQFPSNSIRYSEVCGRVVGYQYGSHEAANGGGTIDSPYLEGISITRGNPRQHVWSLMVGRGEISGSSSSCPCNSLSAGSAPPSFVGNDYFCESGNPTSSIAHVFYPNDPLWDGKQCGGYEASCCSRRFVAGLPWFHKTLSTDTTDYLELRNCGDQATSNENVYINFYEIYVK